MQDEELTAQQRAARAAEAADEARRAAARHAAARRAEQDARRRTPPQRRPPAVTPKPGAAVRGGTAVDPARTTRPSAAVDDPIAPAAQPIEAPTAGPVAPAIPTATPAVRGRRPVAVPDDRSGTIRVVELRGGPAAAAPPSVRRPQPARDAAPARRGPATAPAPAPARPVDAERAAVPADVAPAPRAAADVAASGEVVDVEVVDVEVGVGVLDVEVGPAAPSAPGVDASAAEVMRTGARTGRPTPVSALPQPPPRVVVTQPQAAARRDDGLRLPDPPRRGGGDHRPPVVTAAAQAEPRAAAVSLKTITLDVELPLPEAAPAPPEREETPPEPEPPGPEPEAARPEPEGSRSDADPGPGLVAEAAVERVQAAEVEPLDLPLPPRSAPVDLEPPAPQAEAEALRLPDPPRSAPDVPSAAGPAVEPEERRDPTRTASPGDAGEGAAATPLRLPDPPRPAPGALDGSPLDVQPSVAPPPDTRPSDAAPVGTPPADGGPASGPVDPVMSDRGPDDGDLVAAAPTDAGRDATAPLPSPATVAQAVTAAAATGAATPTSSGPQPWHRSYPPGVPETYRYPLVPVSRFVDDAAHDFPDTTAVAFLGAELSYRQLSEQVDRLAAAFGQLDLGVGDRLAVVLPWCPQLVVVLHACWRAGVAPVVLDPDLPAEAVAAAVEATRPSTLVLLDTAYPGVVAHRERLEGVDHVVLTGLLDALPALRARVQSVRLKVPPTTPPADPGVRTLRALLDGAAPTATQAAVDVEAAAALVLVVDGEVVSLTHHAVLVGAFQARLWVPDVRAGKEALVVAGSPADPLVLTAGMTMAMLAAATLVLPEPRGGGLARTVDDLRPTLMVAPVEEVRRVLAPASRRRDLTSLRVTLAAGPVHDPAVRTTMEQRTGGRLRTALGSPAVAGIALAEPVYADARPAPALLPLPDAAVRVGRPVGDGAEGELEVGGPQVAGGWTSLGLVGRVDDAGFAQVVGSSGTVLAHSGGVSDPDVVAAALRRHPGVATAAVRAEVQDGRTDLVAEVATTDVGLTAERLTRALAEQVPAQAPPTAWRIAPAEPAPPAPAESADPLPADPMPADLPPADPLPADPLPADPMPAGQDADAPEPPS